MSSVPIPAERPAFVTSREPQPSNPSGTTATSEPPPVPLNSYGGRSPLIARTPPPPESPSFAQREAAFSQDPGRPLDPGQLSNLSRGRGRVLPPCPSFRPIRARQSARNLAAVRESARVMRRGGVLFRTWRQGRDWRPVAAVRREVPAVRIGMCGLNELLLKKGAARFTHHNLYF